MDSTDEARKKEARDHWKLLPVAAIMVFAFCAGFIIIVAEKIEVFGQLYYGFSKTVWFLNTSFFGGITLSLGIFSLTLLITSGLVATKLNLPLHPWTPLLNSTKFLIGSFVFFYVLTITNEVITENIDNINAWHASFRRSSSILSSLTDLVIMGICIFIFMVAMALSIRAIAIPFEANNIAKQYPLDDIN
ncbi:MAG: hypothetical protein OIF51_21630 [Cellvibrionaceae bacterium]|nr:hypothetical protein [Cellvibrionaceae bacterium]